VHHFKKQNSKKNYPDWPGENAAVALNTSRHYSESLNIGKITKKLVCLEPVLLQIFNVYI